MPRKSTPEGMILMSILVPRGLRDELEAIRQQQGLTVSQQARMSLTLWVAKCRKVPAQELFMRYMGGSGGSGQPGYESVPHKAYKPQPVTLGPEPDPKVDPVAWAKWSAKAGNLAISKLAAGEWNDD